MLDCSRLTTDQTSEFENPNADEKDDLEGEVLVGFAPTGLE